MKIGDYQVFSVETGRFALDGGAMFGIIPRTLWEKRIPPDGKNRISLSTRSLLLVGNGRNILVDTGNGDKWTPKMRDIFKIDTETVNVAQSLRSVGLSVEDITDVICTHLHFDHAGGNTRLDESGEVVPAFPRAAYWVQKSNLEVANEPSVKEKGSYLKDDWKVLEKNGMMELIDGEDEFIPGVRILVVNGHTSGQQLPLISDDNRTIFFCGDLFPTVHHLGFPWVMAYDNRPLVSIEEKKTILPRAHKEGWILFFEHDREHEAVTLQFDGKNYGIAEDFALETFTG